MDNVIISQFKQGDYSTGIIEGTEALLKMTSIKPNGKINRLPQPKSSLPFLTRFRQGDFSWITRGFFAAIGLAGVALSFGAKPDSYLKTFLFCYGLGTAATARTTTEAPAAITAAVAAAVAAGTTKPVVTTDACCRAGISC